MNSKKTSITVAIMVAMFLAAVEGTVVTTAIPTIVKDLNGFELISFVFSVYLLTSAISTPIYGKLADLYGRKNTLSVGIIIFLVGSCLCGFSSNMYNLIIFRGIQGLGAGAIFTITYTIVGDEFNLSEKAKVQGWLSTVWGVASLVGPLLGGILIETLSWHWIFFVNVPFGLLCIILINRSLSENFQKKRHKIDYLGTVVFSIAIISFLYGILSLEKTYKIFSLEMILSVTVTIAFLILFYFVEKKAKEPIIPFEVLTKTNIIANGITFLCAGILIAMDVYMPLFIQNVLGFPPTMSGISMAPVSVAWLIASMLLSKIISKYDAKKVVFVSVAMLVFSSSLLSTLNTQTSIVNIIVYAFIMGLGFGGSFTILTIMVQMSVDYNNRGAATATNSLLRTLGQTVGVSIFGTIFNLNIIKYFKGKGITGVNPNDLYSKASKALGINSTDITNSLSSSLHVVYITLIFVAIICVILAVMLPKHMKELSVDEN